MFPKAEEMVACEQNVAFFCTLELDRHVIRCVFGLIRK